LEAGYGKFNGVDDGKPKLGIERIPFAVPLSEKSEVELHDEWFSPIGNNFAEL